MILFCIFHACVGFILPSLARLRTMWVAGPSTIEFKLPHTTFCLQNWHHCRYLPNELRGGMMSFSLSLANAAIFVFLLQVTIWGPYQWRFSVPRCPRSGDSHSFPPAGHPPSKHCQFNHSGSCILRPVRSWGLHSHAEAVEEAHSPECPELVGAPGHPRLQARIQLTGDFVAC